MTDTHAARALLGEFAARTGLEPPARTPNRYLWTDAFAVCTLLGLGDEAARSLALRLIDLVHHTLGRHRGDDGRTGWLSDLSDEEGALHPTAGGLRIGKPLAERRPGERFDDRLEWDRDGQYFHYLTKWMHALCRASAVTGDPVHAARAAELAKAVHPAFVPAPGRMHWKVSIDLSRPLVASMGQHDPLDGLVTYAEVDAASGADLSEESADLAAMLSGVRLATDDPLGTGGLLFDAARIAALTASGQAPLGRLLVPVLEAALAGAAAFARSGTLRRPAADRLAFRELGLAVGLRGLERVRSEFAASPAMFSECDRLHGQLVAFEAYGTLAGSIEAFWLEPRNRAASTWNDHREINEVTLAASLAPAGFLAV